jgi:hypothetical protein
VHGTSFVFQSAQGICLAGILVGAGVPALLAVVVLIASSDMVIIFTPPLNFSEVLTFAHPFFNVLL